MLTSSVCENSSGGRRKVTCTIPAVEPVEPVCAASPGCCASSSPTAGSYDEADVAQAASLLSWLSLLARLSPPCGICVAEDSPTAGAQVSPSLSSTAVGSVSRTSPCPLSGSVSASPSAISTFRPVHGLVRYSFAFSYQLFFPSLFLHACPHDSHTQELLLSWSFLWLCSHRILQRAKHLMHYFSSTMAHLNDSTRKPAHAASVSTGVLQRKLHAIHW